MSSAAATNDDLDRLDTALKELRVEYEKYFAGVERIEPQKSRDEFKKVLRRLLNEQTKNTARRFRLQSLQASFVTYESHWNRITRQIEEGTFKRDRWRAERRQSEKLEPVQDGEAAETAASPAAAKAPPTAPAKAPAGPSPAKSYPQPVMELHRSYVEARKQVGANDPVSIDSFAATLQKQYATIKAKYNCQTVDFSVAVKDGKAILKATPR